MSAAFFEQASENLVICDTANRLIDVARKLLQDEATNPGAEAMMAASFQMAIHHIALSVPNFDILMAEMLLTQKRRDRKAKQP